MLCPGADCDVCADWRLLQNRDLTLPLCASFAVGILFGFVYSFMALWLRQASMSASWYFAPYALVALFSAFVVMRRARSVSPPIIVGSAFLAMSLSLFILAITVVPASVVASGFLFALGYSITLPTIIVWAGQKFAPSEQGRPTALTNTVFNVGGMAGPMIAGIVIPIIGFSVLAFALCLLSAGVALWTVLVRQPDTENAR